MVDIYKETQSIVTGILSSFVEESSTREYTKGFFLLRQGEASDCLFIIRRGLTKSFYTTPEGKEFIKGFHTSNMAIGSMNSFIAQENSTFSTFCLEDTEATRISFNAIRDKEKNNHEFSRLLNRFLQLLAYKKELREFELLNLSAKERFDKFTFQHQHILGQIKQKDMASYLGITAVALSRILSSRKK